MENCCDIQNLLSPTLFRALADPRRIGLLAHLAQCEGPKTVSALAEVTDIDLSVVSRHLAMLRDAGILKAEKRGKEVLYQVRYGELASTLRAMADAIEACCPDGECTETACCGS
jgi:DNA-binding transcriptional ArsR family regulator